MLKRLLLWFGGYLCVHIKGYSIERFVNLCKARNISIWNIKNTKEGYEFCMMLKAYRSIRPIARKTKTIPYIHKRVGLPFLLHKYRKRKGFFIGILIFSVILYIMSLFIWDISMEGGHKYTQEAMIKFLNANQVYTGMRKSKVNCQVIEEQIRLKYPDISWVSAEVKGTRLILKITETNMPTPKKSTRNPSHMVATKDCTITNLITRNGTPQVKIGSVVKKGDIIISGIVKVMGDFEAIVNTNFVVADADITCKSFYRYKDELPLTYEKKVYTGEKKEGLILKILNHKINLYNPRISYDKYDIIIDETTLKLNRNFYLPIQYHKVKYRKYESQTVTYSEEEASQIAMDRLKRYLDQLVEEGVSIIENQVEIQMVDNKCIASGKIIVEESCWEYQTIEENEWREPNTDEHSGDNH